MFNWLYENKKNEKFIRETVVLMKSEILETFSFVQDLQTLTINENDVLVLRYKGRLSKQSIENIKNSIQDAFKKININPIILLEEGINLNVLKKEGV
jgi:hypothetical protein